VFASFGVGDALGPFVARTAADRLALAAFVVLLFSAWCAMRALADRSARVVFLLAGVAFVGSLAARSLAIPLVALVVALVARVTIRRDRDGDESLRRASGAFASIGAVLLGTAILLPATPRRIVSDLGPAEETRAALERGNLFEARFWGERWVAESPDSPGDAALVLAEIDWDLGHHARALAIATEISTRSPDEELRRRANERLSQWKEPK